MIEKTHINTAEKNSSSNREGHSSSNSGSYMADLTTTQQRQQRLPDSTTDMDSFIVNHMINKKHRQPLQLDIASTQTVESKRPITDLDSTGSQVIEA